MATHGCRVRADVTRRILVGLSNNILPVALLGITENMLSRFCAWGIPSSSKDPATVARNSP